MIDDLSQNWPDHVAKGDFSFHTSERPGPWWKMELPESINIKKIVIINRLDCCK
jgi:hypothetical protein